MYVIINVIYLYCKHFSLLEAVFHCDGVFDMKMNEHYKTTENMIML